MASKDNGIIAEAMRLLGSRTSEKKAQSSRENGKKGGRPRKSTPMAAFLPSQKLT